MMSMINPNVGPVPDLKEFVNKYMKRKLPMNWHHELFYDILENKIVQHDDGLLYLNKGIDKLGREVEFGTKDSTPAKINKYILTTAPRFHAKSQCFTIDYPLWSLYKNPNVRIMIVSANEEIAISFNRAIVNHLENNHELIDDFGYLVPQFQDKKKWGEKAIIVNRDTMEKDPSVVAVGVGGKLISRRADIIIIDDLIDIESARTKRARNKTREWYENVLVPILEDDGRLVIAGTVWYKDDIYDTLLADGGFDIRMKLKALIYDGKYERKDGKEVRYIPYKLIDHPYALKAQTLFSDEVMHNYYLNKNLRSGVLWERKWSFDKLMEKKRTANMSMASFMRQYLNEPSSEEEKVFKEKHIKEALAAGTNKWMVTGWDNSQPERQLGYGHLITAIGVDLAISKKERSDNSAIAVWGLDDNRKRVLLYLDYGKWSTDETKMKIVEAYHNFHPVKVRVENVAFQDMLRQQVAEDIPVEGFHTTASKKFNPETGLAHLSMLLEQGNMVIPTSRRDNDNYKKVCDLVSQMQTYSYDQHAGDALMASWFALDILKDFDRKMADNRGYFETNALVEQMRSIRAAHRVVILGYNPPFFKLSYTSLVYVFRPVEGANPFIQPDEPFMIFGTRHKKSVAYIFNKKTNEMVAKLDGDLSALMFTSLIERIGMFFNKAQIILDRGGEGEAVLLELEKRNYPNLMAYQPGEDNLPVYEEGFKISSKTLPIAIDYFKGMVDGMHYSIPDEQLVKEMGELIGVEEDRLNMSFGDGQRIKTVATALWLLDNYENMEKQEGQKKRIKKKSSQPRYRIFRR